MARDRDFGDVFDFSTMSDDEIYDVVVQELSETPGLDAGWIDVAVKDGRVTLSGRVATDGEAQVAEKLLVEVLGVPDVANELVVDELHRDSAPQAVDDELAMEDDLDPQLGDVDDNQSDTAQHLVENLEAETFGTRDAGTAIQDGTSYDPPDRVIPGGYDSREDH
jgi:hypothetical protein